MAYQHLPTDVELFTTEVALLAAVRDDGIITYAVDTDKYYFRTNGAWVEHGAGGGSGETNTASNVGTAGVGLYKTKVGVDLRFKKLNAGSNKVSITDDVANDEVDIDVVPGNISHTALADKGTNTHAQIDTHIADATIHRSINDAGSGTTDLWSADKITTQLATKAASADLTSHTGNTSNPHSVTAAQVGNGTAQWNANKIQGVDVNSLAGISDGQILKYVAANSRFELASDATGGGGGEANTASNVGTGGVGVFKQKTGVDLEFKKINAGSNKITITDDTGNSELDIDVAQGNLDHGSIGGLADDDHTQYVLADGTRQITGTQNIVGQLNVDNIRTDGNTISATTGAVTITPAAGSALNLDDTNCTVDGGIVTITGQIDVDSLRLDNNRLKNFTGGALRLGSDIGNTYLHCGGGSYVYVTNGGDSNIAVNMGGSNNYMGLGPIGSAAISDPPDAKLHIRDTTSGATRVIQVDGYNGVAGVVLLRRAAGTIGQTALSSGDVIGGVHVVGKHDTGFSNVVGKAEFTTAENFLSTATGTRYAVQVTTIGATSSAEAFAIENDKTVVTVGNLKIGGQAYQTDTPTNTPSGTTQTIDWDSANAQILTLASATGNVTLTLNNGRSGASYVLKVIQHASSAKNIVWPAAVKWPGGTAPTISVGASAVDVITLWFDGTNYYGQFAQAFA